MLFKVSLKFKRPHFRGKKGTPLLCSGLPRSSQTFNTLDVQLVSLGSGVSPLISQALGGGGYVSTLCDRVFRDGWVRLPWNWS